MIDWWTLVVVAIPLLVLWIGSLLEVLTRGDLRARARIVWIAVILVVPLLGLAAYVVSRPPRSRRARVEAGNAAALELVVLAERRQRREITDAEFAAARGPRR